jgi:hypothetical protein
LFSVYTTAEVSINIGWSHKFLALYMPSLSEEYRLRANELFGLSISQSTWEGGWPMIPLQVVATKMSGFKQLMADLAARLGTIDIPEPLAPA